MSEAGSATEPFEGLEVNGLTVDAGSTRILSQIDLQIKAGSFTALIGPSGAGKSTLIKCVLGLRSNYRGKVLVHGSPLTGSGPVGYVPQDDTLHQNLTVAQELDYAAQLRLGNSTKEERSGIVDSVIELMNLTPRKGHKISKLSGGQRKRVSIALELITSPKVLILDEPTSGLDPNMESKMMQLFQELAGNGHTVIVATHAMESIALCDSVVLLMDGRLICHHSPKGTLEHFECDGFVGIFKKLAKHPVGYWTNKYRVSP